MEAQQALHAVSRRPPFGSRGEWCNYSCQLRVYGAAELHVGVHWVKQIVWTFDTLLTVVGGSVLLEESVAALAHKLRICPANDKQRCFVLAATEHGFGPLCTRALAVRGSAGPSIVDGGPQAVTCRGQDPDVRLLVCVWHRINVGQAICGRTLPVKALD